MRKNEMRRVSLIAALWIAGGGAAVAADCPQLVADRLKTAGYSAKQQGVLCGTATALGNHGIVIHVRAELLEQLARSTFPLTVAAGETTAFTFTSGRYCKAVGPYAGDLLAVSLRKSDGTPVEAGELTAADCAASLDSVVNRLSRDGIEAIVARIRLTWTPWKLTASVTEAATVAPAPASWDERRRKLMALPLRVSPTTGIQLPLTEISQSASLSGAVYFFDDALAMAIGQDRELVAVKGVDDVPTLAAVIGTRVAGVPGNGSILLAHDAVNSFARQVLARAPFPVGMNLPLLDNVDVKEFAIRGARDSYDLVGVLVDGEGETYPAQVNLRGKDLALSDVRVEAGCEGQDFGCQLRRGLADIVTGAARARLEERDGRAWLDYLEKRTFELPWVGTKISLSGKVDRTSSDEEALILHAQFAITRQALP